MLKVHWHKNQGGGREGAVKSINFVGNNINLSIVQLPTCPLKSKINTCATQNASELFYYGEM